MIENMISSLFAFLGSFMISFVIKIIGAVLLVIIGFKIVRVIVKKLESAEWFVKIEGTVQTFLKSFISISLKLILIVSAAIILGVSQAPIALALGSAGLAVGLALQGGLSNIAGGLILILFKPFRVGDYIESGAVSGTVAGIDMFHTIIITPDKKKITVPNGQLANSPVVNYSSEPKRRVDLKFSVAYDSDVDFVRKILLASAANHSLVITEDEEFPSAVVIIGQNEAAVDFSLRVWCESENYWTVYFDLTEDVKKAFDRFDIVIPRPQLNVNINQ